MLRGDVIWRFQFSAIKPQPRDEDDNAELSAVNGDELISDLDIRHAAHVLANQHG